MPIAWMLVASTIACLQATDVSFEPLPPTPRQNAAAVILQATRGELHAAADRAEAAALDADDRSFLRALAKLSDDVLAAHRDARQSLALKQPQPVEGIVMRFDRDALVIVDPDGKESSLARSAFGPEAIAVAAKRVGIGDPTMLASALVLSGRQTEEAISSSGAAGEAADLVRRRASRWLQPVHETEARSRIEQLASDSKHLPEDPTSLLDRLESSMLDFRRTEAFAQHREALENLAVALLLSEFDRSPFANRPTIEREGYVSRALSEWDSGMPRLSVGDTSLRPDTAPPMDLPSTGPLGLRRSMRRFASSRDNAAVDAALEWLAAHQVRDGGFRAESPEAELAVTSLALLAFLGTGNTNEGGTHKDPFKMAVRRLRGIQEPDGRFGRGEGPAFALGHVLATLAMVEGYAATESTFFRSSAEKGIGYLRTFEVSRRGWGFGVAGAASDPILTGLIVQMLATAKLADLHVSFDDRGNVRALFDDLTDPLGRCGHFERGGSPFRPADRAATFPSRESEATTAMAIYARILLGEDPAASGSVRNGVALVSAKPPTWKPSSLDFAYWHLASLALFQVGGKAWDSWQSALANAILGKQRADGDAKGSWDPDDVWGNEGGRVYSTAILALTLETPYRNSRLFGPTPRRAPK